jgi:hypothetical protein
MHVVLLGAIAAVLAIATSTTSPLSPHSSDAAKGTELQKLLGLLDGSAKTTTGNPVTGATRAGTTSPSATRAATGTATSSPKAASTTTTQSTTAATPPAFVGAASAPGGNTRASRVAIPSSAQAGDVAVLVMSATSTSSWSGPSGVSGWSLVQSQDGGVLRSTVWVKTLAAGDIGAKVSFNALKYSHAATSVLVYGGIDTASPVAAISWRKDSYRARHVSPSVTMPAGAMAISYWASRSTQPVSFTAPAGSTVRTAANDVPGGGLAVQGLAVDAGAAVGAGSYGTLTASTSASARQSAMWTIGLTPATTSTGGGTGGGTGSCASAMGTSVAGPLVGAAVGGSQTLPGLESQTGMTLAVHRMYFRPDQTSYAVSQVKADLAAGRQPWISFEVPYSFADMANGRGNSWATALVEQLATVGGPVWLAFHHEPENDPQMGTMQDWMRMQKDLAPIVHQHSNNIAFTIILMAWNALYGPSVDRIANVWPGDQNVDIAGFDMYNHYGVNGSTSELDAPRYIAAMDSFATAHGVRWGLAETAYTAAAAADDPSWLSDEYSAVIAHHGVAMSYFDSTNNSVANWALTDSRRLSAYKSVLKTTHRMC